MLFWEREKGIILDQLSKAPCKPEIQGKEKQISVLINKQNLPWALLLSKRVRVRMIWLFYLTHLKKILCTKILKVRSPSQRGIFLKMYQL